MSVMTFKQTNSFGDAVGTWDAGAKRLENVDFVRKAFESFDVDKSGFLDPQELRAALTMLGVKPSVDALKEMGIEDVDGDGVLSLQDLDADGDQKIDFEEFKCLAEILPKRDHAIYRGSLMRDQIVVPKPDVYGNRNLTPVQLDRLEAQEKTKSALNAALARLREKMGLTDEKQLLKDSVLLRKFQALDSTGDARVDQKELEAYLRRETPDLTKKEAWLIMNCADTNNDKVMTFDEFKRMMQTVAKGVM